MSRYRSTVRNTEEIDLYVRVTCLVDYVYERFPGDPDDLTIKRIRTLENGSLVDVGDVLDASLEAMDDTLREVALEYLE